MDCLVALTDIPKERNGIKNNQIMQIILKNTFNMQKS